MFPLTIHVVNVSYPGTVLCLSDERRVCYFHCSVIGCQFVIILVLAEGSSKCMDLVCPSVLLDLLSVANGNCTPGIEQLIGQTYFSKRCLILAVLSPCQYYDCIHQLILPDSTSSYVQLAPINMHVSDVTYCL